MAQKEIYGFTTEVTQSKEVSEVKERRIKILVNSKRSLFQKERCAR